jgi:transcriptional regulator with XRE-family HTH domain
VDRASRREGYAGALRRLRVERGVSQRELARALGISQPLVARTEAGARLPDGPEEIAAVARALSLAEEEQDELLLMAGLWPSAFVALGPGDVTLRAVARTLADPGLTPATRQEVRRAIEALTRAVAAARGAAPPVPAAPPPGRATRAAPRPQRRPEA